MADGNFTLVNGSDAFPSPVHATDVGQYVKPGGARSFADRFGVTPDYKLLCTVAGNKLTPTIVPPDSPLLP